MQDLKCQMTGTDLALSYNVDMQDSESQHCRHLLPQKHQSNSADMLADGWHYHERRKESLRC